MLKWLGPALIFWAGPIWGDPVLECVDATSQVETADCLIEVEGNVAAALAVALDVAMISAEELDEITGREVAMPALTAAQSAWEAYLEAQCDFVGAGFGGGSGTGIGIRACRITLTRERIEALLAGAS